MGIPTGIFSNNVVESAVLANVSCSGISESSPQLSIKQPFPNAGQEKPPSLALDNVSIYYKCAAEQAPMPPSCFVAGWTDWGHPTRPGAKARSRRQWQAKCDASLMSSSGG